jgi:hypothetical protein
MARQRKILKMEYLKAKVGKLDFKHVVGTAALVIVGIVLLHYGIAGLLNGEIVVRSRGAMPYTAYAAGPFAKAFAWNAWGSVAFGAVSLTYGIFRLTRQIRSRATAAGRVSKPDLHG